MPRKSKGKAVVEEHAVDRSDVDKLQGRYDEYGKKVDQLKANHPEVFAELQSLLTEQNAVLDQLTDLCRKLEVNTPLITVIPNFRRQFNGRRLYRALGDRPEVRRQVITIEYKVNAKAYDEAVRKGEIGSDAEEIAVKRRDRTVTVRAAVKPVTIP